ncbi:MAG: hypothetical protein ACREJO_09250 [Phycisphaerales bacterium]
MIPHPQPDDLAQRVSRLEESLAFSEQDAARVRELAEELSRQVRDLHAQVQRLQRRLDTAPNPAAEPPSQRTDG